MKLLRIYLIILLHVNNESCVYGVSFNITDIAKSVADTAKGVFSKIPDTIPKPEEIFQSTKNLIAGYPLDAVFSAINQVCEWLFLMSKLFLRLSNTSFTNNRSYVVDYTIHFY